MLPFEFKYLAKITLKCVIGDFGGFTKVFYLRIFSCNFRGCGVLSFNITVRNKLKYM